MRWLHAHLVIISALAATAVAFAVTHSPATRVVVSGGSVERLTASAVATSADTHLPPYWRQRELALLGAPRSTQNLVLLAAWGKAEGGTAKWNPLNTTYPLPFGESWPYNGSSVQNYWKPTGGVAATALTLIQPTYACILGALQGATLTAAGIVNKCVDQFHTWGTSTDLMLRLIAQAQT